ncbi:MAG: hypothetical protein ACJA1F_001725 [Paracoccaceae bacterium]|jgi:hypothetical protein
MLAMGQQCVEHQALSHGTEQQRGKNTWLTCPVERTAALP